MPQLKRIPVAQNRECKDQYARASPPPRCCDCQCRCRPDVTDVAYVRCVVSALCNNSLCLEFSKYFVEMS
eukprot:2477374-Pleurochrysis_carterae.AAC.2